MIQWGSVCITDIQYVILPLGWIQGMDRIFSLSWTASEARSFARAAKTHFDGSKAYRWRVARCNGIMSARRQLRDFHSPLRIEPISMNPGRIGGDQTHGRARFSPENRELAWANFYSTALEWWSCVFSVIILHKIYYPRGNTVCERLKWILRLFIT